MLLKDANILISDDSILARKQLKDFLTKLGACHFIEASNGQQAVDVYQEKKPDVAFFDIVMPVKDGITAITEIKKYDPEALIIIVSSAGTKSQLKAAIEAGAKDFIQKPISAEQIRTVVNAYFE